MFAAVKPAATARENILVLKFVVSSLINGEIVANIDTLIPGTWKRKNW